MRNANYDVDLPKLEDIIEPSRLNISSQQSIGSVLNKINKEKRKTSDFGYVFVVDKFILVGILTKLDIIKLIAAEIDLSQIRVSEVMSSEVIALRKDEFQGINQVLSILQASQIKHLPIVDDEGKLLGVIREDRILNLVNLPKLYETIKILRDEVKRLKSKAIASKAKMQAIGDGVITIDSYGKVQCLNLIAEKLTGWQTREAKNYYLADIFNAFQEDTREPVANIVSQLLQNNDDCEFPTNSILISRDQTEYAIETLVAPIRDRFGQIISMIIVFRDVTKARQLADKLS